MAPSAVAMITRCAAYQTPEAAVPKWAEIAVCTSTEPAPATSTDYLAEVFLPPDPPKETTP